ncbi:MAG: 30S ribosomal protein S20 [Kordiimonadaceae bacterium]|nr:30S ribosomal protein S20 [Kordiimonadaceae bacterium]
MANTLQSKKRIRSNGRKAVVNKARVSRIRTFIRAVDEAITAGDKTAANDALKAAQPEMMRGVTKGIWHKKTASRKVSRLSQTIKALA